MKEPVIESAVERPRGVDALLGTSEVVCDKCGNMIRHLDRYSCNTLECAVCGKQFNTIMERDAHFSKEHPENPSRGARYCFDCSVKAGYIKI